MREASANKAKSNFTNQNMSQDKPTNPSVDGTDLFIGIVASRYNNEFVEALLTRARATLRKGKVAESSIKVLRVPGAAEIPYVANMLAQTGEYDAIIALGVIIKGDTSHDEVLANSTAISLQGIALQSEVPVINGILAVNNREQAQERTSGTTDRGAEFARAALEMAWHHVHLGDYLDHLDEEAEREELESSERLGYDDDDDDDFHGHNPFHKN
jgi:6,7-dimethyl-8-ribityllumazine synthase